MGDVGIRTLADPVRNGSSGLHQVTTVVGTGVSETFLYLISAINVVVLAGIAWRARERCPVWTRFPGLLSNPNGATNGRFPYRWNPKYPARIGVMPRDGDAGDVRWFEIEPCYVFHPLNAYDEGDAIVLDVVRYDKVFDTDLRGPTEGHPALYRWTVDLASGKVREEQLDDRMQEFPRVDERLTGRRHRYGYAPGFMDGPRELLKHDLDRRTTQAVSFGPGREPGEFVFVPRAEDSAEDDGVLMGFVYDAAADRSDLVLLDAATLDTVASIHLPARIPNGFHGNWVPDSR